MPNSILLTSVKDSIETIVLPCPVVKGTSKVFTSPGASSIPSGNKVNVSAYPFVGEPLDFIKRRLTRIVSSPKFSSTKRAILSFVVVITSLVWKTMGYQLCKSIGAMAAVLSGNVDAIILTGGLLRFDDIAEEVRRRTGWIAPVVLYPGEVEQEEMAGEVLKVMRGEIKANAYTGKPVFSGFPWDENQELK